MKNIRAIIVDDENHCQITLKKLLEWNDSPIKIVGECNSVEEAKKCIEKENPNLVFLDIEMPEKNGFDLLYELPSIDFDVIFTTAYDEFALEAFKTNAIAYLLKPIDKDELKEAIQKVKEKQYVKITQTKLLELYDHMTKDNKGVRKIAIPTMEGIEFLYVDNILRCEAEGNYSHIFFKEGKPMLITKTLKQLEVLVEQYHFFRPHNSHLINMQYIQTYHKGSGGSLKMEDGSIVPVSRYRKEELQKIL